MGWLWTKQTAPVPIAVNGGTATTIHNPVSLDRMSSDMLREYVRSIYLWRSVDMIAQMSSSVVLEVHNGDKVLTSREQQVAAVLARPNPQWTGAALQYFIAASLAVANRSFLKQ